MTQEQITEGNRLIAEFMQHRHFDSIKGNEVWYWNPSEKSISEKDYYSGLKYHSSWDWLMPVVAKIDGMVDRFEIEKGGVNIMVGEIGSGNFFWKHGSTNDADKITLAWWAVVAFIQYHNQIKNQTPNTVNQ